MIEMCLLVRKLETQPGLRHTVAVSLAPKFWRRQRRRNQSFIVAEEETDDGGGDAAQVPDSKIHHKLVT